MVQTITRHIVCLPASGAVRLHLREGLSAALSHLREVRDKYWDHGWRRERRGYGRYPENELWDAVEGYLDLLDASRSGHDECTRIGDRHGIRVVPG